MNYLTKNGEDQSLLVILDVSCLSPESGVDATLERGNRTYAYLETANYTCNNPAAIVTQGSLSLRCQANGEWSDSPPVCGEYI